MISYSTNWMGPVSQEWYQVRRLTKTVTATVESEFVSGLLGKTIGEKYEREEITEHWAAGRIDIYGLDEKEYYGGMCEYGLPPMRGEDWNRFSEWLDDFVTDTLWDFEDIIAEYEKTNPKITWDTYNVE